MVDTAVLLAVHMVRMAVPLVVHKLQVADPSVDSLLADSPSVDFPLEDFPLEDSPSADFPLAVLPAVLVVSAESALLDLGAHLVLLHKPLPALLEPPVLSDTPSVVGYFLILVVSVALVDPAPPHDFHRLAVAAPPVVPELSAYLGSQGLL